MNAQPNYNRFPGPGDLPGDNKHPNSPDFIGPDDEALDAAVDAVEKLPRYFAEMTSDLADPANEAKFHALYTARDGEGILELMREIAEGKARGEIEDGADGNVDDFVNGWVRWNGLRGVK